MEPEAGIEIAIRRFRSPNEFSLYIESQVAEYQVGYMEAVLEYCEEQDIDIDNIGQLINLSLKEKIEQEAIANLLMKPKGQLQF